ncbi:hypothetical protein [Streptomyces sp. NPDC046985]|uniref:hypothetical protein n=1 Tax=Streptomyces sp. NPDC046985 TaxID=3155377 RepID=UPI0033F1456F
MSGDDEHGTGAHGPDGYGTGAHGADEHGADGCRAAPGPAGPPTAEGPPYAECVLCREPTEYPESYRGITLCPVCAWLEAQRKACSG